MKRVARAAVFNFRPPFAAALSLAGGIGAVFLLALYGADLFWLIAVVPVAAVIFIAFALFARTVRAVAWCAALIAVFFVGVACAAVALNVLGAPPEVSDGVARLAGRVEEVRLTASGRRCLVLSSVTADGTALTGKVLAYLGEEAGGAVEPGYRVEMFGLVGHYDMFAYGALDYRVADGVRYFAETYGQVHYSYGFSLFCAIRSAIYGVLFDNLDYETAAVAYAMITGSTRDISDSALDSFRFGGVSHIFAVSGLNITVLYVSLSAVLKKCGVNRWVAAASGLALVFFYAGVCGFALSAVRAAVMCAVGALASLAHGKYDGLNSLSVSVIVILLANPVNLFDVGFVLSVCAMLGIVFLGPGLSRLMRRLPTWLKSNVSMSVASQAATLPALLLVFGYISGAGLILNIVVLPVMTFLYVLMFACVVACLVLPFAAPVLAFAALPLQAVVNFFVHFGFEDSLISGGGGWWLAVVVFACIAALSDKFNFSHSFRAAACGVCAVCFALGCFLQNYVPEGSARIIARSAYSGGMALVRSRSGSALILACDTYPGAVSSFVNEYAPGGVDDVIIVGGDECASYYYSCGVEAERVWMSPHSLASGIDGAVAFYHRDFELHGAYYEFTDGYTLSVTVCGARFCFAAGERADPGDASLAFVASDSAACSAPIVVRFDGGAGDFDLYRQGCLQFVAESGKLELKGPVPAK